MPEVLTIERHEHACVVRLQRPAKLNAISSQMERELCDALLAPEVRDAPCVIFTGGERVFSAGADLNQTWGLEPGAIMDSYRSTGDFAERVADLPQPTLSAISGYCLGGGLELALATDFRIAEPNASFGLPEVALGILPSWGGTHRLVRLLGPARAREVVLLYERIDAVNAHRIGLVTELAADGTALERALSHAQRLASLPPLAVSVTGQVIEAMAESSRTAGLALERIAYGMLAQTEEANGALTARWKR